MAAPGSRLPSREGDARSGALRAGQEKRAGARRVSVGVRSNEVFLCLLFVIKYETFRCPHLSRDSPARGFLFFAAMTGSTGCQAEAVDMFGRGVSHVSKDGYSSRAPMRDMWGFLFLPQLTRESQR